jgi:hypothetical protein
MPVIPELVEKVKGESPKRPGGRIGTVRVDVQHQEKKTLEAVYKTDDKSFKILMDEPEVRGGTNRAPTPLGTFVTGAAG